MRQNPPPDGLCILVPVWADYAWLVPIAIELLDRHWPGHPPIYLLGLTSDQAGDAPHFPTSDPSRVRNWSWMVRDGVRQARENGYRLAYLIAEEHTPFAACHVGHLHRTLPAAMDSWGAAYISLMGWDNRRFALKNPILGSSHHRMMHLTAPRAPRFHLHPALWRLDVLERCCDIALEDNSKNGSAWHFEKTCDKANANLPDEWKAGCYQIAAHTLSLRAPARIEVLRIHTERWIFNRLMALIPHLPRKEWAEAYKRLLAFDDVFCHGPYPMIFSGILQKGRLNEYLVRRLRRDSEGRDLLSRLEIETSSR